MKYAKVSSILKGGSPNDPNNYRPISVLPVFSKDLEKIIHCRMVNFFDKFGVIPNAQHGFRKHRSTETALLSIKQNIIKNIEMNIYTLALFIDFSKAFDCLRHSILLEKLERYGIRGICSSLFKSYLSDRFQTVCANGHMSSFLMNRFGVPQESVLGPHSFNVYINDIVNIYTKAQFIIYADDSTVMLSGNDVHNLTVECNALIENLSTWSQLNQNKINATKTKIIIFRSKNKLLQLNNIITFEGQKIEIVDSHKILGVYFSSHLSWNMHVNYLCKKLSSGTGVVSRCRSILPISAKVQIYNALFNLHLYYCALIWCTTTKTNIPKVLILQKKVIRYVGNIDYSSSTREAFPKYNVIRIDNLYTYRLLHSARYSSELAWSYIEQLASLERRPINVNTRNPQIWSIAYFRTLYKHHSLTHNLPFTLNKYKNIDNFSKKELRSYLVRL